MYWQLLIGWTTYRCGLPIKNYNHLVFDKCTLKLNFIIYLSLYPDTILRRYKTISIPFTNSSEKSLSLGYSNIFTWVCNQFFLNLFQSQFPFQAPNYGLQKLDLRDSKPLHYMNGFGSVVISLLNTNILFMNKKRRFFTY